MIKIKLVDDSMPRWAFIFICLSIIVACTCFSAAAVLLLTP